MSGKSVTADCSSASAIKERPILFSTPMVRALLDGRKTQTRRIVKPQPETYMGESGLQFELDGWHGSLGAERFADEYCKFGRVGDRLWVRETWMPFDEDHNITPYAYRASTSDDGETIRQEYIRCGREYRWRPSIHMPRAASRITLEITSVRVECVMSISENDAKAEGIEPVGVICGTKIPSYRMYGRMHELGQQTQYPIWAFESLWGSIHASDGPNGWNANPWVWAVGFKIVSGH